MNHKQKVKLARNLRTTDEIKNRVSVFNTAAWNARKEEIRLRVIEDEKRAKAVQSE